jgi:glyoxylase-like metal-dependent hydrolase (beta-lactamase superfamily II)
MVEILPGVHKIDGVNPYSYVIVEKDGSLTLVDTGMSKDGKKVLDYIHARMTRKPSDVKTIVLTHCHTAYVRGAYELRRATGATLAIHEEDADYLSGRRKMSAPKGAVGVLFKISEPLLTLTPTEPDQRLKENDLVGGSLTVLHTPGHTPGGISLFDRQRKRIFVADLIRNRRGKLQGPPEEFAFEVGQARKSLQKIASVDFNTILSGEGETFTSNDAPKKIEALAARL